MHSIPNVVSLLPYLTEKDTDYIYNVNPKAFSASAKHCREGFTALSIIMSKSILGLYCASCQAMVSADSFDPPFSHYFMLLYAELHKPIIRP